MDTNRDVLEPGSVFTIEPGLYYPDRGMGVRLENTVWIRPDGAVEVMAPYSMNLVLPVRGRSARRTPTKRRRAVRKKRKSTRTVSPRRKTSARSRKKAA